MLIRTQETFGTIESIIRHVQVTTWQEKAIFVHFDKMKLRNSQNPILAVQKKLFKNLDCTPFLDRRLCSKYFLVNSYIKKMLIETRPNFWYKPECHTMRTSDYMAGESEFCRFLKNEAPK